MFDAVHNSLMENWGTNTSVPAVTVPPLAITFTTSTCRSARSRTAATISPPPLLAAKVPAMPARDDRWTGGNDPGQPVVNLSLRVSPVHHVEMPVAEVTNRRHTSGQLPSQRPGDHGLYLVRGIPGDALQRQSTAVANEVDMSVNQPRQYSRIAVVDQLTLGGQFVGRRLDPHYPTVLDEHGRTAGAEAFTIKGVVCTDRERSCMATQRTGACQRVRLASGIHSAGS